MPTLRPISYIDAHSGGQLMALSVGYVFSGRVDATKVTAAVKRLSKAWPGLAADMLADPSTGQIMFSFPDPEDSDMEFTVKEFPHSVSTVHKPMVPTPSISIQSQRYSEPFSEFLQTTPIPNLQAFLAAGPSRGFRLQLSLFEDASIFTFFYLHTRMDAGAMDEVMKQLAILLGDPDAEVQPELEGDPFARMLAALPEGTVVPRPPAWQVCFPEDMAGYMAAEAHDAAMDGESVTKRIYWPRAMLKKLRADCVEELIKDGVGKDGELFLSDGDVITAWLWKHIYADLDEEPNRPVRFLYTADARPRLPDIFTPLKPYFGCGFLVVSTEYTPTRAELASVSVAKLAGIVREIVNKEASPTRLKEIALWKGQQAVGGGFQLPFKVTERFLFCTSWLKFDMASAALPTSSLTTPGTGKVIDVYVDIPGLFRGGTELVYKDAEGAIVQNIVLGTKQWEKLAKYHVEG